MSGQIEVLWGDQLEKLADALFDTIHPQPVPGADPWRQPCVVVNSPTTAGWLKQYFVFGRRGRGGQRVLANLDIQYLYVFVNDWLGQLDPPAGDKRRKARAHPYAVACLQWRIYRLLTDEKTRPHQLKPYIEDGAVETHDRRRFSLAGVLAKLFDDYQVYRPDMLINWELDQFNATGLGGDAWQRDMWRRLIKDDPNSYLKLFRKIGETTESLGKTGLAERYSGIHVFGVSAMPPVYLHFLQQAAMLLPVHIYSFNPCGCDYWMKDVSPKEREKVLCLHGKELKDEQLYLEVGNPLLSSLGKGLQFYLEELLDRTGGQPGEPESVAAERQANDSVLHVVQEDVRRRRATAGDKSDESTATREKAILEKTAIGNDSSVQIHLCHSPWREVEVLRDHLLKWFASTPGLQPRDIQVLVSDMESYMPYIDAVFATEMKNAGTTIPYAVSDRGGFSTCQLASAFLQLLDLPASRFEASVIMGFLDMEAIRESVGLSAESVARLRGWVQAAGVRWSRDAKHAGKILGENRGNGPVGAAVGIASWQAGLDRLLAGYAMGSDNTAPETGAPVTLGSLDRVLPVDLAEGSVTADLGRLVEFFERLDALAGSFDMPCTATDWEKRLTQLLDDFFVVNNQTGHEVAILKQAVRDFVRTVQVAGFKEHDKIPRDIAAVVLEQGLADSPGGDDLVENAVLFSSLRAMRATPRRIICLLGMDDGIFPRSDRRAAFDLMARERRRGDRSDRMDDRLAFLEALMSARDQLYISYRGRNDRSNEVQPPSTVVCELRDYLRESLDLPEPWKSRDGQELLWCETLHRLQPFHHDYFSGGRLFSYSKSNLGAAKQRWLVDGHHAKDGAVGKAKPPPGPAGGEAPANETGATQTITFDQLVRFLGNPARAFYTQVLQVRFDDAGEENLPDRECLATELLERYQAREFLVEAIRKIAPGKEITDCQKHDWQITLSGRGLIPPGAPGQLFVAETAGQIRGWLECEVEDAGKTVRILLQQREEAAKQPLPIGVELTMGDGRKIFVVGSLPLIAGQDQAGDRTLVFCRYTEMKTKDLVRGHLAQLLVTASGKQVTTLVVAMKEHKATTPDGVKAVKPDVIAFKPSAGAEAAQGQLAKIAALYSAGQKQVVPFAQETSYAFAVASEEEAKAKAAGKQAKAPAQVARAAWRGGDYARGESTDPYHFRAFGDEGPMKADAKAFALAAGDVCQPIAKILVGDGKDQPSKADPETSAPGTPAEKPSAGASLEPVTPSASADKKTPGDEKGEPK